MKESSWILNYLARHVTARNANTRFGARIESESWPPSVHPRSMDNPISGPLADWFYQELDSAINQANITTPMNQKEPIPEILPSQKMKSDGAKRALNILIRERNEGIKMPANVVHLWNHSKPDVISRAIDDDILVSSQPVKERDSEFCKLGTESGANCQAYAYICPCSCHLKAQEGVYRTQKCICNNMPPDNGDCPVHTGDCTAHGPYFGDRCPVGMGKKGLEDKGWIVEDHLNSSPTSKIFAYSREEACERHGLHFCKFCDRSAKVEEIAQDMNGWWRVWASGECSAQARDAFTLLINKLRALDTRS